MRDKCELRIGEEVKFYERTGKWWGTSFHNWQAKRKNKGPFSLKACVLFFICFVCLLFLFLGGGCLGGGCLVLFHVNIYRLIHTSDI